MHHNTTQPQIHARMDHASVLMTQQRTVERCLLAQNDTFFGNPNGSQFLDAKPSEPWCLKQN